MELVVLILVVVRVFQGTRSRPQVTQPFVRAINDFVGHEMDFASFYWNAIHLEVDARFGIDETKKYGQLCLALLLSPRLSEESGGYFASLGLQPLQTGEALFIDGRLPCESAK